MKEVAGCLKALQKLTAMAENTHTFIMMINGRTLTILQLNVAGRLKDMHRAVRLRVEYTESHEGIIAPLFASMTGHWPTWPYTYSVYSMLSPVGDPQLLAAMNHSLSTSDLTSRPLLHSIMREPPEVLLL